ncbi:MAG: hypothetical protein F4Y60_12905 [Boseongicola sp. SB0664_bin_43]|uniref:Uncharacterized protein n=1 Tax=Boseongicola sp. SB0664_bin_43 TaxID=2604844 RepID=A0A6B0Y1M1_9RHOB|nr:hypothetical protein [Boseongicola sp. SB0664_bin_43]MYK30574.1 hypothetical protein [Boseongicola sp. SB0670_bin_30]
MGASAKGGIVACPEFSQSVRIRMALATLATLARSESVSAIANGANVTRQALLNDLPPSGDPRVLTLLGSVLALNPCPKAEPIA